MNDLVWPKQYMRSMVPVNHGERNESRIAVTPDPSVFLEGLARETKLQSGRT